MSGATIDALALVHNGRSGGSVTIIPVKPFTRVTYSMSALKR